MAFNLYFAGSSNKDCENILMSEGFNRLCSQLNERSLISKWVCKKKNKEVSGNLFIDSGAFTAHTKGSAVDVDDYISYINSIDDSVDIFAQLDKIPGKFGKPKTQKELMEAPELSWNNYLYMRDRVKSPEKLLPIFHQGEDFKWLKNMLEWVDEKGDHIPYIGISPANDSNVRNKDIFIEKCFAIIKNSSNPHVKTHAFGMTSLKLLEKYPFTSADSTSWIMTAINGSIQTPFGSIVISNQQYNNPKHYRNMPKEAQDNLRQYVKSFGFDLEDLEKDYSERIKFSIYRLKKWSEEYTYKPTNICRKKLF